MVDGFSDKEIAEKLFIAPCTVRSHKNHIYQKLGVSGSTRRIQAVNIYIRTKSENRCAFKCLDNTLCDEGEHYKNCIKKITKLCNMAVRQQRMIYPFEVTNIIDREVK